MAGMTVVETCVAGTRSWVQSLSLRRREARGNEHNFILKVVNKGSLKFPTVYVHMFVCGGGHMCMWRSDDRLRYYLLDAIHGL